MNWTDYEIKTAKTGHKIPVVDGVHLHSIYDPIKEAISIGEGYKEKLRGNSNVLIFGMGFGYHLEVIRDILRVSHENFKIVVIEPNKEILNDSIKLELFNPDNYEIHAGEEVKDLFLNEQIIEFLLSKPLIIPHTASFNHYKKYFTTFLGHDASSTPVDFKNWCPETKGYFDQYPEDVNVMDSCKRKYQNPTLQLEDNDLLLMSLIDISKQVKREEN